MSTRFLLPLIFWAAGGVLFAQKKILPVRIDQKWGYIGLNGKVVIEPAYDALGDENLPYHGTGYVKSSAYRLMSVGDRCGLLDKRRREALPPRYKKIFVLSDSLLAARSDSGFFLLNMRGQILMDLNEYDDVQLPVPGDNSWSDILLVKKNFKWGVVRRNGKVILAPQYAELEPQRDCPSVFVVARETGGLKGLVDAQNKTVLDFLYADLIALDANLFARKGEEGWIFIDRTARPIMAQQFYRVSRLNRQFYAAMIDKGTVLFSVKHKKTLGDPDVNYKYYEIDDHFLLKTRRDSTPVNILNADGLPLRIKGRPAGGMKKIEEGLYAVCLNIVRDKKYWGLWKRGEDSLRTLCIYTKIERLNDSLLLVEIDKKKGLLNRELKEVIPPVFNTLQLEGDFVKLRSDTSFIVMSLLKGGNVSNAKAYGAVQTIAVKSHDYFVELPRTRIQKRGDIEDWDTKKSRQAVIGTGGLYWVFNEKSKLYDLKRNDTLLLQAFAERVIQIPNTLKVLVFSRQKLLQNEFARRTVRDDKTPLCLAAIFDLISGRFITDFDLVGVRYLDFIDLSSAVFIDTAGWMGIIDTNGIQARTKEGGLLRCAYIGDFADGRARFAAGGSWVDVEEEDSFKNWELPPLDYYFGLTAPEEMPASFRFRRYAVESDSTAGHYAVWGVLDSAGRSIIPARYDYIQTVTPDGAIGRIGRNWGVLNFAGDTILGFRYRWISDYGSYWKIVVRDPNEFFFSSTSHVSAPIETRSPELYKRVGNKPGAYGLTGPGGKTILAQQYPDARYLGGGRTAYVHPKTRKWMIADTAGKTLSNRLFDAIGTFIGNRSLGTVAGRPCLADGSGNIQFLSANQCALGWSEGFLAVDTLSCKPSSLPLFRQLFLNEEGINEFGQTFFEVKPFENGLAKVRKGFFWGTINRFGLYVSPPKYVNIEVRKNGVEVKVPTMMGLADKFGKIIIPPRYDRIEMVGGECFRIERGDAVGYLDLSGKEIWKLRN